MLAAALLVWRAPGACQHEDGRTGAGAGREALDAVLILDSSGSMLLTDPRRLRDEGAKLFVEFLKPEDRLAVIEFSGEARLVRPLTPMGGGEAERVGRLIGQIKTVGEYTNLLAPLKLGESILQQSPRPDASRIMIMLSDGKMDPDPKKAAPSQLSNELINILIPELKAKDVRVYTLSFSDQADAALLSQIAAGTGAVHRFAPTADQLHQNFAELFVAAKKPQMLPISSKGFRIDPDVEEATFYINRQGEKEVSLLSPSGRKLAVDASGEGTKWFRGTEFDVITIERPEPGQWEIQGLPKNEGFATVLTSLKLSTSWPAAIYSGTPALLEVRLYEAKKPIVLPQMTGVVTYAYEITPTDKISEPIIRAKLSDQGSDGDAGRGDGVYSALVTIDPPGEYRLRVLAVGPTFERYQQLAFRVKPRLVSLDVVTQRAGLLRIQPGKGEIESGESEDYFRVTLSGELSGAKKTLVKLVATDGEKKRYVLPLTKVEDLVYLASAQALPGEGAFHLKAFFEGEGRRRERLMGESTGVDYVRTAGDGAVEVVVKVVEKEEPPAREIPPWVGLIFWLLVVSAVNGGILFAGRRRLDSAQTDVASIKQHKFEGLDAIMVGLAALQKKAEAVEVDLEDPALNSNAPVPLPAKRREARPAAAPPAAAQAGAAAAAEEAAPAAEAEAPGAAAEDLSAEDQEAAAGGGESQQEEREEEEEEEEGREPEA